MGQPLSLPHRKAPGMCPVNGIRDLVHWRTGRDWSSEFVHGLGQGGGFAYLRFNAANPPRQVYWGIASPRQHEYLAGLLNADYTVLENRSFKLAWTRAREAVDEETPPVLGPLDMFHLPWYAGIYHLRHIPIHYLLLVGYDEGHAHVLDTGQDEVQPLALADLQPAWDVNVPGMGKRNRLAILDLSGPLAPTDVLIRRSIADQCRTMLRPPVSLLGLPAMRKLAREIARWPAELGESVAAACLRQMREYLNVPPDLAGGHLTAGRDLYLAFLQEAGPLAGLDLTVASGRLRQSIAIIPQLADAIGRGALGEAAAHLRQIAEEEEGAYAELSRAVGLG